MPKPYHLISCNQPFLYMRISTSCLFGIALVLSVPLFAQPTVNPDYSTPYCPSATPITYQFTSDYSNLSLSSCAGCTSNYVIDGNGYFTVTFTDAKNPHTITATDGTNTWKLSFAVSSLVGIAPTPTNIPFFPSNMTEPGTPPTGYQSQMEVDYCNTSAIPFIAPPVFYQYNSQNYGVMMTAYQWKIPKGWSLNDGTTTTVSTGSNTISTSTNSVGIIPDPISGAGSAVEVWVLNDCNRSLSPSDHLKTLIYRANSTQSPVLTVNGGTSLSISCGSTTAQTFTASNVGSCVTGYQWNTTGWLYNGNPVTGPFTTSTPSISLTPQPGATPGNVSVTYVINGTPVTADTYTVPVTVTLITPNLNITGPQTICSGTQTYSIANIPTGSTITWTLSSNLSLVSGQGTSSIQVQASVSSGQGTIQATITNPCFTGQAGSLMTVGIGVPNWSQLSIVSQGPPFCANVPIGFGARYAGNCTNFGAEGITNVNWTVSSAATITSEAGTSGCSHGNNSGVTIRFNPNPTQYNVWITATNACGTSSQSNPYTVTLTSGGSCPMIAGGASTDLKQGTAGDSAFAAAVSRFEITPNPTSGRVLIGLARNGLVAGTGQPSLIRRIDVYNSVGAPVRSLSYGTGVTGTVTVDLGTATPGIYILAIQTDKGRYTEKVELIK